MLTENAAVIIFNGHFQAAAFAAKALFGRVENDKNKRDKTES